MMIGVRADGTEDLITVGDDYGDWRGHARERNPACGRFAGLNQFLMNASRSALIVSACVVGMPCGNPL
jgi:hypothetical protein